jgi:hypothetical protein
MELSNDFWKDFFDSFTNECKQLYSCKGFSYDIPKEEQIRSSLYSFLKGNKVLLELESDLFLRKNSKVIAEYDLRLISNKKDILIEIKRSTALDIWTNDYTNFEKYWKKDIEKLDYADCEQEYDRGNINCNVGKCFLLFVFTNETEKSQKNFGKLSKKIESFKEYINEKWTNNQFYETNFVYIGDYISGNSEHKAKSKMLVWWK